MDKPDRSRKSRAVPNRTGIASRVREVGIIPALTHSRRPEAHDCLLMIGGHRIEYPTLVVFGGQHLVPPRDFSEAG